MGREYRDRIYIRKDVLLNLYEHGQMNQNRLMSICGMNNVKHKEILDEMVEKEIIEKSVESRGGTQSIIKYKISQKGLEVFRAVLEPYEAMFPRRVKDE